MRSDDVAPRLAELRALYVPESDIAARERLARERPAASESFEVAVDRRLRELSALCALASHLRQAQMGQPSGSRPKASD